MDALRKERAVVRKTLLEVDLAGEGGDGCEIALGQPLLDELERRPLQLLTRLHAAVDQIEQKEKPARLDAMRCARRLAVGRVEVDPSVGDGTAGRLAAMPFEHRDVACLAALTDHNLVGAQVRDRIAGLVRGEDRHLDEVDVDLLLDPRRQGRRWRVAGRG